MGELGRAEIEVLFVPPTIRELDKLKNPPAGQTARQLSSDARALVDVPGRREVLRADPEQACLKLRSVTEAPKRGPEARPCRPDLDVTRCTICGTGRPGDMFPAELWVMEPELDESGKEIPRLKAENGRDEQSRTEVQLHSEMMRASQ